MNATDLLIDAIRDHIEATATSPLSACSFVIRDNAIDRTFPQCRTSERSVEEHEIVLGTYLAQVDVTIRTNPEDTSDAVHQSIVDQAWQIVADTELKRWLSQTAELQVFEARCSGPMTEPDDDYRATTFPLRCVYWSQ